MTKKRSDVDVWLERETPRVRKALETASQFLESDHLTVHTLEAVYGQESSFGTLMGKPGSEGAAGHFQFKKRTAERFGLKVSKKKDERFDMGLASSAAVKYLNVLSRLFTGKAKLGREKEPIPIRSVSERRKFILGAYNAGEGYVARAQHLAAEAGRNPQLWQDVRNFIEAAGAQKGKNKEAINYVEEILLNEVEFKQKSKTGKKLKQGKLKQGSYRCAEDEGRWRTIDDRPVLICDKKTG